MRKRYLLPGVLLLVLLLVCIARYDSIVRLYHVLHLFDEDRIVTNFSNMHVVMPSGSRFQPVNSIPFETTEKPLPEHYQWQGQSFPIEAFLERTRTTSLLVLHDGIVVHEDYRLGTGSDDLRISWSMAKSFLSALFGIAVHEGLIDSLEDPVTKYVPELSDSAYDGVSIVDTLNMASGVAFDEDYLAFGSDINRMGRVLALGGSMDEFAHSIDERARAAGLKRHYVSIDTHVLAMVLRKVTGTSLHDYFEQQLWSKLNTEGPAYYLTDGYGVAFALGGLNMRTRDYARFGELFRHGGEWQGQQIIPKAWVSASTQPSAPASLSSTDPFGYGFQWWVPPEPRGDYYAGGIYGQFIYVDPENAMVIVKTSAHREFRDDGNHGQTVKHETITMMRAIVEHLAEQ